MIPYNCANNGAKVCRYISSFIRIQLYYLNVLSWVNWNIYFQGVVILFSVDAYSNLFSFFLAFSFIYFFIFFFFALNENLNLATLGKAKNCFLEKFSFFLDMPHILKIKSDITKVYDTIWCLHHSFYPEKYQSKTTQNPGFTFSRGNFFVKYLNSYLIISWYTKQFSVASYRRYVEEVHQYRRGHSYFLVFK